MDEGVDVGTFRIDIICDLHEPFRQQNGQNDYAIFEPLKMRYGVYIFQHEITGAVLYVGRCGDSPSQEQDLKGRITQYYTEKDTGGTFKNNWTGTLRNFEQFKFATRSWRLVVISIDELTEEEIKIIGELEKFLIFHIRPIYNTKQSAYRTLPQCQAELIRYVLDLLGNY